MVDSNPEDDSVLFSCLVVVPTAVACATLVLLARRLVLALVVDDGSGMYFTVFTGISALRAVFVGVRMPRGMEKCAQSMLQLISSST